MLKTEPISIVIKINGFNWVNVRVYHTVHYRGPDENFVRVLLLIGSVSMCVVWHFGWLAEFHLIEKV